MSGAKQLRLLPAPKPLTERLGQEFFLRIEKAPGVYRMFDAAGRLLYVGQSRNLHDRLNSYRHVHPDRDSRKTVRLVHLVRRIEWEVCATPTAAVLLENQLLRTLRPRFNRMNVFPKACFFVGVERGEGVLKLSLTRNTASNGRIFGAFKGASSAFASLCRLLFIVSQPSVALSHFPIRLLTTAPLRQQNFSIATSLAERVEEYLAGEGSSLVEVLTGFCATVALRTPFEQNLMLADLITTEDFFARGPVRVRALKQQANVTTDWVEPELLVDFLATDRLAMDQSIAGPG